MIEHVRAKTFHARRGDLKNRFTYGVDYVLAELDQGGQGDGDWPLLISRNRFNLWSLNDRHHGGPRKKGNGRNWFAGELEKRGFSVDRARLVLLAQPAFLWFNFTPVSFWIALIDDKPCAFVAEVNSTFGQRHCYFCAHDDFSPIAYDDRLTAQKLMHVSPFQKVEGQYHFNFGLDQKEIKIRILYENGEKGLVATLTGERKPATSGSLLAAAIRRPFGAVRVVTLIHWQAAKLYLKGANFLGRHEEPKTLVSDSQNLKGRDE